MTEIIHMTKYHSTRIFIDATVHIQKHAKLFDDGKVAFAASKSSEDL